MWPNPQENCGLVTFTEEILNGKLHFLCSEGCETFDAKENVYMSWKSVLSKVAEWTAIILIDSISSGLLTVFQSCFRTPVFQSTFNCFIP